jgi:hypothetical protein
LPVRSAVPSLCSDQGNLDPSLKHFFNKLATPNVLGHSHTEVGRQAGAVCEG